MGSRQTNKLSVNQVKYAKPPPGKREIDLSDGGNLVLRVRATGKAWRYPFQFKGERDFIYIGEYPAITLARARELAQGYSEQLLRGENPKQAIEAAEAVEHARALANEHGKAPATLGELFQRWKSDYLATAHSDKGAYISGIFERHVLPGGMADLRLDLMRPMHMKTILQRAQAKGLTGTTKRVLDSLRQMFKWSSPYEWLVRGDPTLGFTALAFGGRTNEGDRTLSEEEVTLN